MIIYCPGNCTEHVDYPHFIVRKNERTFVLCRECGHWIERQAVKCFCKAGCHTEVKLRKSAV